jgi:hypothetical protein
MANHSTQNSRVGPLASEPRSPAIDIREAFD